MKVIASFHWNCGRMGDVNGLFICEKERLTAAYGKSVYFGEILGKHSEVTGELNESDIEIKSEDQDFIAKFEEILGGGTISGYNPLAYLNDEDGEEEEESDEG